MKLLKGSAISCTLQLIYLGLFFSSVLFLLLFFFSLGKLNHERNLNKLNLKLKIVAGIHNPSTREDDTGDH